MRGTILILWTLFWSFLLLELGVRAWFSFRVGPDVLLWGTQWHRDRWQQKFMRGQNVFEHNNAQTGYSKYFPNQKRSDVDSSGATFAVTINSRGFRGIDHSIEKPADTLRIVALGASSTFGFGNRDDETYPAALQALLNQRLSGSPCNEMQRAEVINLGIPHLDSAQIATLFTAEGLPYRPDVVTVYSGYNNTLGLGLNAIPGNLSRYWLVFNFIRVALQQTQFATESLIQRETEPRTRAFVAGLDSILATARQQGIEVVPVSQQVRSLDAQVIRQQQIGYADEMDILAQKLATNGKVSLLEGKLLIHQSLSHALRRWARQKGLVLVDGIELFDAHRYLLASYVHLSPLANELLALAIADEIAARFKCPQLATRMPGS